MEFDETPRFWYPRVALAAWINFAFSPDENLRSDFRRSEKETKRRKIKIKSLHAILTPSPFVYFFFYFYAFYFFYFIIIIIILFFLFLNSFISFYCIINHVTNYEPHIQVHHIALAMCHSLEVPCGIRHPTPRKMCNFDCLGIRRNSTW